MEVYHTSNSSCNISELISQSSPLELAMQMRNMCAMASVCQNSQQQETASIENTEMPNALKYQNPVDLKYEGGAAG